MAKSALGIIETVGLAAGAEAADAAVKSANVNLIGYELTKGSGMVLIKVEGDVGAVKAAIDAANAAASKVGTVAAKHIIPRPHGSLEKLIYNKDTVGLRQNNKEKPAPEEKQETQEEKQEPAPEEKQETQEEKQEPAPEEKQEVYEEKQEPVQKDKQKAPRKKKENQPVNQNPDPALTPEESE